MHHAARLGCNRKTREPARPMCVHAELGGSPLEQTSTHDAQPATAPLADARLFLQFRIGDPSHHHRTGREHCRCVMRVRTQPRLRVGQHRSRDISLNREPYLGFLRTHRVRMSGPLPGGARSRLVPFFAGGAQWLLVHARRSRTGSEGAQCS